jgi:hypothetical protein
LLPGSYLGETCPIATMKAFYHPDPCASICHTCHPDIISKL